MNISIAIPHVIVKECMMPKSCLHRDGQRLDKLNKTESCQSVSLLG